MSPEQRSEQARRAVMARWGKLDSTVQGPLAAAPTNAGEIEFARLAGEWKQTRPAVSSTTAIAMHPAYQRIVGMGKPAVPLILRELGRELDHWFWALRSITGEDPVSPGHAGKMREMAADWLRWGREKGYVR
jgi:hypothetical protein